MSPLFSLLVVFLLPSASSFLPPTHTAFLPPCSRRSTLTSLSAMDSSVRSQLLSIQRSFQSLTERLADPDVLNDPKQLKKVMSDRRSNEEVVEAFESYLRYEKDLEDATDLFRDGDAEMKEMAREEVKACEAAMSDLESSITLLLLPKDPNDDRNVMLEIRAGTGGSEANIFAGDIYDVYVKFCKAEGWRVAVLEER